MNGGIGEKMGKLQIHCLTVGMLATNCYILYDEDVKQALIADPGDDAEDIVRYLQKLSLTAAAILLTHGHSDHFKGLSELKQLLHVPAYIPEADAFRMKFQGGFVDASYEIRPEDVLVKDGDILHLGGMEIEVIHTPGHTEGGTCYYFRDQKVLLSGDTLFYHSWGRTDFPGGNEAQLFTSIRQKLLPLPEETIVLPGHERSTTIREERRVHRYY